MEHKCIQDNTLSLLTSPWALLDIGGYMQVAHHYKQGIVSAVIEVIQAVSSLRFDPLDVSLKTTVGEALVPAPIVRLFDATGNNITHPNASARIELVLADESNMNGGDIFGNSSAIAENGVATFDNVKFNEAGTFKRLTAYGRMISPDDGTLADELLINAT